MCERKQGLRFSNTRYRNNGEEVAKVAPKELNLWFLLIIKLIPYLLSQQE